MTLDPVALLWRMLKIESVSGHEGGVASLLVAVMRDNGFDSYVDEAGNAVGVLSGPPSPSGGWRELVLLGHMDTVSGRVPVRFEGDLLYGRGAVDAKGPLAAFVAAAARADLAAGTRVVVVGAVEEESTSRGARALAGRLRPTACIIGEPSGWDAITLGYKGRLVVDYRRERAASHTAGPDGGVAEHACDWWAAVREHAEAFNRGRDRVFDRLQPYLGRIATSGDGLADVVEATVRFRLPVGVEPDALFATVCALAGDADLRCSGSEPAFESARRTPIARPFLDAIRRAGGEPRFKVKTGTSDMNVVGPAWGCPIVAYGPGDSRLDHTPDEHISIAELRRSIDVLEAVIRSFTADDADARRSAFSAVSSQAR